MDHFLDIMEEHSYKNLPPAFIYTNLIIFFLSLMHFFTLSKNLSLALTTMVNIKIPNQNLIPHEENPSLLCYPLICIVRSIYNLHLG